MYSRFWCGTYAYNVVGFMRKAYRMVEVRLESVDFPRCLAVPRHYIVA